MSQLDEDERVVVRILCYLGSNALLFAAFSVLWVAQYHTAGNVSDSVDHIIVPWGWLAAFFGASFLSIRRPLFIAIPVAASTALLLSGALFLLIRIVLVPIFDPMF